MWRKKTLKPSITRTAIASALAGTFLVIALAQAAYADDDTTPAPAPASQPMQLETVTVTGSMIKRADAETAEAITILKADALKAQGITSVEQVISTLTSSNPSVNIVTAVGTFSGGGSYADLRGLGRSRTLVLLDGERLAPNAFDGQGVDVSGIPFSAIESVEVLREGASALYGSDAIAGVINFITKKNYQGGEIQLNFNRPQKPGGSSGAVDFSFGHGNLQTDGYNYLVTASYSKQKELRATQRAFSAQGFNPDGGITSTNYPGSWPGNVLDSNGNLWQSGYPDCTGNTQLTTYFGDCTYRYSAATDLLPESHELSGMAEFTKSLPFNNQLKLQYFVSKSELNGYSGPMFYFFEMDPASPYFPTAPQLACSRGDANCAQPVNLTGINNVPFLPDGVTPNPNFGQPSPVNAIWTDPNNSRYNGNVNVAQRLLLTFSGFNNDWDYAADINLSKNTADGRNTGGYPNEDLLAPGGVLSPLINPFGPQSVAGQALIDSSYLNGTYQVGKYTRWSVDGHATHPLGDAFNAGMPATLALGASLSGERYTNATTPYNDLVSAATGLTDSAVEGSRQIQAAFVELDVPITKSLDLTISDRQDRYSDFGKTNNAKVQLLYQATSFLTVRAAASTGFRAPTLNNLYSPLYLAAASGGTMGDGNPFCQPGSYTAEWTPATCAAQGIGLFGGNKTLTPETSQNFDLGVILSPIADLGITIDYYRILLKNRVGTVPASAIYGDPASFSSYIVTATSGPYAGTLPPTIAQATTCDPYTATTCGYISRQDANTGFITTDGIDLSVQYQQRTLIGTFKEVLEGTWVTQFLEQQYTGGPTKNLLGNLAIQGINPAFRWQHNVRVDWTSLDKVWGGGLSDRFYSGYRDESGSGPDNAGPRPKVGSYSLIDGYASVKPVEKLTVLLGIKNIFNTSPPFTNASQNNFAAGYNALIADPLLRNFYINLKYSL